MMASMDPRRTITAYFRTAYDATEVAGNLRTTMEVEGPKRVTPVNGRPFEIVIVIPESMSPMIMFPDSHLMSRIQNLVMAHDGLTTTPAGAPS